ncbi:MAG: excinuclease ABC subunit UvrC [Armatimonadetes bacterium]|nr:excinuclease ABC subunit UvrC [Armatimonadota bacterium]
MENLTDNPNPAVGPEGITDSLDWATLESKYPVTLTEKLRTLPSAPGCYLMKNHGGEIIYIGKAKIIRNRVRQYFQKGADQTRRTRRMVYEITDLEWIVTDTELEALILESNLIKKHHPAYNVRLRDDKSYPYIAVTLSDEWPRVAYARKLRMQPKEKDRYFGPYTDTEAVRETLRLIRRVFRVPCGFKQPELSKGRACMYYHIGQCTGVCAGKISKEEYMGVIQDVMAFLVGKREELVTRLLKHMEDAAENLEFEKAARLRDQVQAIQTLIARQKVISTALEDQDVIALVTDDGNTCAEMFFIRGGKLIGQEHFLLENASADELSESLREFIEQYYDTAPYIPREVLLSAEIGELDIIESWLRQKRGTKVSILSPKRGEKRELVEMAKKNADLVLKQLKFKMATDEGRIKEELEALQAAIGSPTLPRRIEAYDISNIQGYHTVASLVVFENGQPKKAHYRKFKIKRPEGTPDDYASMKEVVSRRLFGSLRRTEAFADLPDLMLIDGGKGQLNAALEAMRSGEWKVESGEPGREGGTPTVIGLAKRNEEIFKPGFPDPIILPRNSKALRLIQRIRDEAHRFAITYHRNVRGKTMRASKLNDIPGIGMKRRRALLKHFGTMEKIRSASVEELAAAPSMNIAAARAVHAFSHSETEAQSA